MFRSLVGSCALLLAVPSAAWACEQHQPQRAEAEAAPKTQVQARRAVVAQAPTRTPESAPAVRPTTPPPPAGLPRGQPSPEPRVIQPAAADAGTQLKANAETTMSTVSNTAVGAADAGVAPTVTTPSGKKKPSARSLAQPKAAPGGQ